MSTVEKLIGPREPTLTDAGSLSPTRITKTRRHALFEAAVTSAMLALGAETFAVVPGIMSVDLAVVAPGHLDGPAGLMLTEVSRDAVLPKAPSGRWKGTLVAAAEAGRATLVRDKGGHLGALRPLVDDDPDVRALLDGIDADSRSNDLIVVGVRLPSWANVREPGGAAARSPSVRWW